MKGPSHSGPQLEVSRSLAVGGPSRSFRLGKASQPDGTPLTELSVPASAGEARDLVLRILAPRVLDLGREAGERKPPLESDRWAASLPPQPEAQIPWALTQPEAFGQAAADLVLEGNLILARGVRHQVQEAHEFSQGEVRNKRLVELRGASSWVVGTLQEACREATWFLEPGWPELEEAWPRDLALDSLWLVGASDLAGDQLLLLQGSRESVMACSQGLFPARTAAGRESLIVANTMAQQLHPLEAAILTPWALQTDALLWLWS